MEIGPEPKNFELGINIPDGRSITYFEDLAKDLTGKTNSMEIAIETADGINIFPPKTVLCEGFYPGENTPFDLIMMYSFAQSWCFLGKCSSGCTVYVDAFGSKDHRSVFSIGEFIECQEDDE